MIFSKSYCPYCKRAKGLFASEFPDVTPTIIECVSSSLTFDWCMLIIVLPCNRLDQVPEGSEIQDYLAEKTSQRTVPNIFVSEYLADCAFRVEGLC